jgi:DNA invertase Pin-like site-specific DNA recombinase
LKPSERHLRDSTLAEHPIDRRPPDLERFGDVAGPLLDMLGVFAEFETNLRRERQLEGIAKAKAAGVYKGRPASIDAAQVRAMRLEPTSSQAGSPQPSVIQWSQANV